jgi:hypothetical protein
MIEHLVHMPACPLQARYLPHGGGSDRHGAVVLVQNDGQQRQIDRELANAEFNKWVASETYINNQRLQEDLLSASQRSRQHEHRQEWPPKRETVNVGLKAGTHNIIYITARAGASLTPLQHVTHQCKYSLGNVSVAFGSCTAALRCSSAHSSVDRWAVQLQMTY